MRIITGIFLEKRKCKIIGVLILLLRVGSFSQEIKEDSIQTLKVESDSVFISESDSIIAQKDSINGSDSLNFSKNNFVGIDSQGTFSLLSPNDSITSNSIPEIEKIYFQPSNFFSHFDVCSNKAQSATGCFRSLSHTATMGVGFPGVPSRSISLKNFKSLDFKTYYSSNTSYSPYELGGLISPTFIKKSINGSSIIEIPFLPSQLDTPQTEMVWERGALGLNSFRIRASRMTTQNSYLALELMSQSLDSLIYSYSFQVHQPYVTDLAGLGKVLPFLKRDSSDVVIQGASPKVSVFQLRPRLGIYLTSNLLLELYFDQYNNKTQLSSPHSDTNTYDFFKEQQQTLLNSNFSSSTVGGNIFFEEEWGKIQFHYSRGSSERKPTEIKPEAFSGFEMVVDTVDQDTSPITQLDTSFVPIESSGGHQLVSNEINAEVTLVSIPFEPTLIVGASNHEINGDLWVDINADTAAIISKPWNVGYSDQEYANINWKPQWKYIATEILAGTERHSLLINKKKWLWNVSGFGLIDLPYGFQFNSGYDLNSRQPSWVKQHTVNSANLIYGNPDLTHEIYKRFEIGLDYTISFFNFDISYFSNTIDDVILPKILPYDGLSITEDSSALQLINYDQEVRNILNFGIGLSLGNWSLDFEISRLLSNQIKGSLIQVQPNDINPLLPKTITKGTLAWANSFVSDRMHLSVWWDWEWFSHRYSWAPNLLGQSEQVKLDEYLSLDFNVQMRIKTFSLYYNIKNFNHDRYTLQPGYHPPGVNFRWGVHWQMNG